MSAYGYPAGGTSLSFTKGHISRTQISTIALSGLPGITVQTSAPINPGNSGGPITIQEKESGQEKCIGIVTQGYSSLSSVAYFIPAITVVNTINAYRKFGKLKSAGFIDYVTVPALSFSWQTLKNAALRAVLGLSDANSKDLTGIYVNGVPQTSCAYGILEPGDIILKIDGHSIQSDGYVEVEELENSIDFRYLIQRKVYGSKLDLVVLRKESIVERIDDAVIDELSTSSAQDLNVEASANDKNKGLCELTLTVVLNRQLGRQRLLGFRQDKPIKYHIQPSGKDGAFVFSHCTASMIEGFTTGYNAGGTVISDNSKRPRMFDDFEALSRSKDLGEIVVLHSILTSEETDGYEGFALSSGANCISHRIVRVNGQPIRFLADLVLALQSDPAKPATVEFDNGNILCIAPVADEKTISRIQSKYQIAFFTSKKLADTLKPMNKTEHTSLFEQIKQTGKSQRKRSADQLHDSSGLFIIPGENQDPEGEILESKISRLSYV
ncbi:S1C family serine protease [Legionella genomosp. 1]|uniref:S1C family serine protease n=1 Tax=Legionella genomosp. 1 TaxID=1093625 RepID=UPI0013EFAD1C|nr:S1C family serine protease [Legionella genomosp. 1]